MSYVTFEMQILKLKKNIPLVKINQAIYLYPRTEIAEKLVL